jgi:hypothetical protein
MSNATDSKGASVLGSVPESWHAQQTPDAAVDYDAQAKRLIFGNGIVSREFSIDGGLRTVSYLYAPSGKNLVSNHPTALSDECTLVLDDARCAIGTTDSAGFCFAGYDTVPEGEGTVLRIRLENDRTIVRGDLLLTLHYALFPGKPYLLKWLTLENRGGSPVHVKAVAPEVLTMPQPAGVLRFVEPTFLHRPARFHSPNSSVRFRYYEKRYVSNSATPLFFLDRHSQVLSTGLAMINDYANVVDGGMGEICPAEGGGIIESHGNGKPPVVSSYYGVGPDTDLAPGASFTSFRTYECFFTGSLADGSLAFCDMILDLFPWTRESYLTFLLHGHADATGCRRTMDLAADLGFEFWKGSVGTFIGKQDGLFALNSRVFPGGASEARELVRYGHAKGLRVSAYVGLMWALWSAGESTLFRQEDWYLRLADGTRFMNDERPTGVCMASGWGAYVHERCSELVRELELDALETDGPYDGFLCHAPNHCHRSPAESQYLQWEAQRRFFNEFRDRGTIIVAPQGINAIMQGNSGTCCGAEGWQIQDGNMEQMYDAWDQIVTVRQDLWYSSLILPPTCLWHSQSVWRSLQGLPPQALEHWLATNLGYGITGNFAFGVGATTEGAAEDTALLRKWLAWFKRYRSILTSNIVHLRYPDGMGIDAIMHINRHSNPPGFLLAFNPTGYQLRQSVIIPAKYVAGKQGVRLVGDAGTMELDTRREGASPGIVEGHLQPGPAIVVDLELGPREIAWYEIRPR